MATHGADVSDEMLKVAAERYPIKELKQITNDKLPYESNSFGVIFCFHVIMHLPQGDFVSIMKEVHRILKPQGIFIFDFPSKKRKKLVKKETLGWHGASSYSKSEITALIKSSFTITSTQGILFIPIHRLPIRIRKLFGGIDRLLGKSPHKWYSSYMMINCKKKKAD